MVTHGRVVSQINWAKDSKSSTTIVRSGIADYRATAAEKPVAKGTGYSVALDDRVSGIYPTNDAGDAQRAVGQFHYVRHRTFGAARERREKNAFDHEDEAERDNEIGHQPGLSLSRVSWQPELRRYLFALLAPAALLDRGGAVSTAAPSADLPEGSPKKRKKSESGRNTKRVSPRVMLVL